MLPLSHERGTNSIQRITTPLVWGKWKSGSLATTLHRGVAPRWGDAPRSRAFVDFQRVFRRDANGSAEPRPTTFRPLSSQLSTLSFAPNVPCETSHRINSRPKS